MDGYMNFGFRSPLDVTNPAIRFTTHPQINWPFHLAALQSITRENCPRFYNSARRYYSDILFRLLGSGLRGLK